MHLEIYSKNLYVNFCILERERERERTYVLPESESYTMNGGEGSNSYAQNSTYQIYFLIYFSYLVVFITSPFNGIR